MMSPSTSRLLGSSARCTTASRRAPAPPPPRVLDSAGPVAETLRLSGLAPCGYSAVLGGASFCRLRRQISFPTGDICKPVIDVQPRRDIAWTWRLSDWVGLTVSSLNLPPPDQSLDRH